MNALAENPVDPFIPISAITLREGDASGFDIFVRVQANSRGVLFCSSGQTIASGQIQNMCQEARLFIHRDDRERYQEFLRLNYEDRISDERIPIIDRISVLNGVIRDILGEQFAHGTTDSIVENCQQLGMNSINLLGSDSLVPKDLCRVLHHDFGTFTHSANVSAYAVVLGRALGFSESDLTQIAVGGLLHDLGKLDISEKILNKPGKLSDEEFQQVKRHPVAGLQRVGDRSDLSCGQLMMIYQHHERVNGQGYPVGCSADEIHPWSKLCAVVDVFEALTSHRSYRRPFTHEVALAVLQKGIDVEFDREILTCWNRILTR